MLLLLLLLMMVLLVMLLLLVVMRRVRIVRVGPNVHLTSVSDDRRCGAGSGDRCDSATSTSNQIRFAAVLSFVTATQTKPVMGLYRKWEQKLAYRKHLNAEQFYQRFSERHCQTKSPG